MMLTPERQAFVEEYALLLASAGYQLMDGRVLAYLMVTRAPYSSSADIATGLGASSGSVSMSTRRLVELGQIRRHIVPGERSHFFKADTDVWGSWLASERRYLERERSILASALESVEGSGDPRDDAIVERLKNGRDYFAWLQQYHTYMHHEWIAFKAARDAGEVTLRQGDER